MTFFKLITTTTIVGLTCTAALANEINFSQNNGSINTVAFTQTGSGGSNSIGSASDTSEVNGSLNTLSIEQNGGSNEASFDITTDAASEGTVEILATGDRNNSTLTVNQGSVETLAFAVAVNGNDNSFTGTISGVSSVVDMESNGNNVAYTLNQTGAVKDTSYDHKIIANVSKTGTDEATVALTQSGAANTIELGAPSSTFGTFGTGTVGLTLLGAATVSIDQSATLATYKTTQTVPAGGSLTVVQSN